MGVSATPNYHRQGAVDILSGSNLTAAPSRTVVVLPRGAVVDGTQAGTAAITVRAGHGIVTGQKFMVGTNEAKFFTAGTVTATSIPLSTGTVDVTDGDVIVNLGNDSGTTSPNYDATTVPIYDEFANASAENPSTVVTSSAGKYAYWSTDRLVWELVLDASSNPDTIIREVELSRVDEVIELQEVSAGPSTAPTSSAEAQIYLKGDNLILKFNDAGTTRYKYLPLSGTTVTWVHVTSEP